MLSETKKIILLCIVSLFLSACAGRHEQFSDVENLSLSGSYNEALEDLEAQSSKLYDLDDDAILYNLDKGLLSFYAKDYEASNMALDKAEQLIFEYYSTSITETIGSALVNDNVLTYQGEDYEDIYLNLFKALNYINLNNYEAAFVEVRRIDTKIKALSNKYSAQIFEAKQAFQDMTEDTSLDTDIDLEFIDSAFARYISLLMYRANNQLDEAKIDLNYIKNAYQLQPSIYNFSLPRNLEDDIYIPKNMGRLNIISLVGLSPIKDEFSMFVPIQSPIQISLPVLEQRKSIVSSVLVNVYKENSNELHASMHLDMLESVDNIVRDTFKQKQMLIYTKTIVRAVTKHISAQVTKEQLKNNNSSAAGIVGLFFDIYNIASEQADLRIARFFPSIVAIGGFTLEEGEYFVDIIYKNNTDAILYTDEQVIHVKEGNALNLINSNFLQ